MIGLDTNVIVRYLMQDDPVQSRQATELLEWLVDENNPGFVSVVAMAETAWVLERSYDLARSEIAAAIERLLQIDTLTIESEQQVFRAMTVLKDGRGSFGDALIGALGAQAGCTNTCTFDRGALKQPEFVLL